MLRVVLNKKKKIDNINFEKIIKYGIYDENYGYCKPLMYVEYDRHYYILDETRLTHDSNIKYYLLQSRIVKYEENEIFEIKTNFNTDLNKLNTIFPMNRTRFSKYCNGFEKFFNSI